MPVDLAILTDDELQLAFDELCGLVIDTDVQDKHRHHKELMRVTAELGRRTDAWIAARRTVQA